ncbi:LAMI_0D11716g1_1 [Lachancea mirantina]|uniref:LAMI_0D11716g1_1 n=1 Tax=Lachancea mirantina TaxID=1230905 RepID=A0A1G4JFY7_9SACH|nr:LAMI_0D11716g1_1 [Lachancea mirantina]
MPMIPKTPEKERLYDHTVTFHKHQHGFNPHRALVFIHGGAWIDPTNTPHDFDGFSQEIVANTGKEISYSLYGIEYRLSPLVKHPTHICDVIENLCQLIEQEQIDELNLMGHSVGATLAWQILSETPSPSVLKEFIDVNCLKLVRSRLKMCYLAEGIFSVQELLNEYPDYDYFISQAFTKFLKFDEPADSLLSIPPQIDIRIIHSYADELLSPRQTNYLAGILQKIKRPYTVMFETFGKHNEVYCNRRLAKYIVDTIDS